MRTKEEQVAYDLLSLM